MNICFNNICFLYSFNNFSENKLPSRCKFFSSLKGKYISEKDYFKVDNMWNVFKMNAVTDYYGLYLKTNIL